MMTKTLPRRSFSISAKVIKYTHVFKVSIMDAMVYLFDFIGRSGFFAFIIAVYLMLWKVIYSDETTVIEGFDLRMMIWYLVLTEIITLSSFDYFSEVATDIKTGNVAYLLNKPYNYITYCFANNMGKILFRLLINTVVGIIIGMIYVGTLGSFEFYMVPFLLVAVLLGTFIDYFINFTLALTAFWLEENVAFRWIYQKLVFTLGGMLLPLDLFPEWLEGISKALPFAYITYGPAKLLVDFSYNNFNNLLFGQIIYLMLAVLLCYSVYRRGVKKLNVNGG